MASTSSTTNLHNPTPAQQEFQDLLDKNTDKGERVHPEDRRDNRSDRDDSEQDEEDQYRHDQINAAMRAPNLRGDVNLPSTAFDAVHSTGVKGVIADARAYEEARQGKWRNRVRAARRSVFGLGDVAKVSDTQSNGDSDEDLDQDEEAFLRQWRENRRQELEKEARNGIRTRRTSPSLRMFGRMDTVDALGYLDAIEKVGRETVVVVFVYDHECEVSHLIEQAMRPLVTAHPHVHFVKVHYEDIEFDNAAVPTILAYRNQGDLFANMTGVIEMIPEDEDFDTAALSKLLKQKDVF
ncbi:Uu.00g080140.m01.CDS01 [Anthostomella pinea]|uniref:Uu.00g080140.m01.CDS01 n=1 Tax=Anthostomella pinea TaxID=933095 RepID=A0AAI8YJE9_9PEZI|nr:Uu.00g080140.m01.CDS01 [Anthostomella pinea]